MGVAFLAALLFGASTPFAKLLVGDVAPLVLAGLLYLGSGAGLSLLRSLRRGRASEARLTRRDAPWLAGAILFGGVLGPALLMLGLANTGAAPASLLLNLEGVFTALLAWFVFHENFDRRIALGMVLIVAGGLLLSWQPTGGLEISPGALCIVGACLAWGIDNNLTQRVSAADPLVIAGIKGAGAGAVNLAIGLAAGGSIPEATRVAGALAVGFLGYGVSLACFVLALRHIGTARTGAYFSTAPFVGAALSLAILRESVGPAFWVAGGLMAAGVWLHLTERHEHSHIHERLAHSHRHIHDEHHRHDHGPDDPPGEPHTHAHTHPPFTHAHAHYPDIHHRHRH